MKRGTRVLYAIVYALLAVLFVYSAYQKDDQEPWIFTSLSIILALYCFWQLIEELRKPRM